MVAASRALRLLYQNAAPDWFILLSGADYPTAPAEKVVKELKSSGMDVVGLSGSTNSIQWQPQGDRGVTHLEVFRRHWGVAFRSRLFRARKSGIETLRAT